MILNKIPVAISSIVYKYNATSFHLFQGLNQYVASWTQSSFPIGKSCLPILVMYEVICKRPLLLIFKYSFFN